MKIVTPNFKTTLLLNSAWQPINTITARAAFMHLLKGRVSCLDKNSSIFHTLDTWNALAEFRDDQPYMRSAHQDWPIPTIVVVTNKFFKKPKKKKLTLLDLARIYDFKCQYCLEKFSTKDLTIDHIHPKSKGGTDDHENRTLACVKCNSRKSNHFPWQNINGEEVTAPPIPALMLNAPVIREEWNHFITK